MLEQVYPLFTRGRIMKKEMPEAIRNYSFDFDRLYFGDYSDGILSGCQLSVEEDNLLVGSGIVKYNGKLYLNPQSESIPYSYTDKTVVLSYSFGTCQQTDDFIRQQAVLSLDEPVAEPKDRLELCRYKLKKGAKLRTDYVDYDDMSTEYDTVNILHSPFAGPAQSTLAPEATTRFAREALAYIKDNPWDIAFCLLVQNSPQALSKQVLQSYLAKRSDATEKNMSNQMIYNHLRLILQEIKGGNHGRAKRTDTGRKQIRCD